MNPVLRTAVLAWVVSIGPASQGHADLLKIATLPPDGTLWMKEVRRNAAIIEKRTAGRVQFRFYPGGVMGNDTSVLRKIRVGQLQGGGVASGALAEIHPDSQTYGLPMLFRSYEEVDYVRSRMDDVILKGLEGKGLVAFGIAESGFAYLMSSRPIRRVEDLEGLKVWVPRGDPISRTFFETAGRSPIPLPVSDVLTGLQTGLIETVGTPPIGAIALQWHTAVKYLTEAPLLYTYGMLVFDPRAFNRLSHDDREIIREVLGSGIAELNKQNRKDNESAKQALKSQGITFVRPSPEALERLRSIAAEATARVAKKEAYTPAVMEALQSHLKAYRKNP
ncbi:MAG TPA: TRAP transporter substrate-binding protein DctP [Candidatus Binatia bacterium]|nr:TRAP transporter substrate-binding protein DctP [Candidatus Binatia bacterium]